MGRPPARDAGLTVVFDLGGVLVDLDRWWPASLGLDLDSVADWLAQSVEYEQFESGKLGGERFFAGFGAHHGVEPEAAAAAYTSMVRGVSEGAEALVSRVARPCCLSNSNPLHWAVFDPGRRLRRHFDTVLASQHLGARKPDPIAFERAQRLLGDPEHVVFLDDSEVNVAAASDFGWDAVRVEGVSAATEVLDRRGLLRTG